jgi:hypothetical protein
VSPDWEQSRFHPQVDFAARKDYIKSQLNPGIPRRAPEGNWSRINPVAIATVEVEILRDGQDAPIAGGAKNHESFRTFDVAFNRRSGGSLL